MGRLFTTESINYTETSVLTVTSVRVVPCTAPSSLPDHVEPPYLKLNLEKIVSALFVPGGDGSIKCAFKIKVMYKLYIVYCAI